MSIAKLKLDDSISPNLGNGCDPASFQDFAQLLYEDRWSGSSSTRKLGKMASETGIYNELFLDFGLCELEEKDLGG